MTTSPDLAWQTVLYSTISAAVSPTQVEVMAPAGTATPFVRIGESVVQDHPAGFEVIADVHVFSTAEGSHEAKALASTVVSVLHGLNFTGSGWTFTNVRQADARMLFDVEDETWHSVQSIRVIASQ